MDRVNDYSKALDELEGTGDGQPGYVVILSVQHDPRCSEIQEIGPCDCRPSASVRAKQPRPNQEGG